MREGVVSKKGGIIWAVGHLCIIPVWMGGLRGRCSGKGEPCRKLSRHCSFYSFSIFTQLFSKWATSGSSPRITNLQVSRLRSGLLVVRCSIRRFLQPMFLIAWDTSSSVVDLQVPHIVRTLGCLRRVWFSGAFSLEVSITGEGGHVV